MVLVSSLRSSLCFPFKEHSQIVNTLYPSANRAPLFFESLSILPPIFSFQNCSLVFGQRKRWHSCPCQKHPLTNIAALYLGKTIWQMTDVFYSIVLVGYIIKNKGSHQQQLSPIPAQLAERSKPELLSHRIAQCWRNKK